MKVWFPGYRSQAHREDSQGEALAAALREEGIECNPGISLEPKAPPSQCSLPPPNLRNYDAVLLMGTLAQARSCAPHCRNLNLPIYYYVWDLYPSQIRRAYREEGNCEHSRQDADLFRWYLGELKSAATIFVPSKCTAEYMRQYTDRPVHVVLSAVHTWQMVTLDDGYVLDAVRKLDDPNERAVLIACNQIGVPCKETMCLYGLKAFREVVADCRLLVSAYYQASTGGLSLLEAYALGKPLLVSDSPQNGAVDYLGPPGYLPGVTYFDWQSPDHLRRCLRRLYDHPPRFDPTEAREWVEETYNNRNMAKGIAKWMKQVQK